jgi:hypothetical protein
LFGGDSLGCLDEVGRNGGLQPAGRLIDVSPHTSAGVAELRAFTEEDLGPLDSSADHD